MSYQDLIGRMRAGGVVVLDGGTGTELERRGVPMSAAAWCGPATTSHRAELEAVHIDYIRAGAEVITANTFASSRLMLSSAGFGDQVQEINRAAVDAALTARDRAGRAEVIVAGSLSHMLPVAAGLDRTSDQHQVTDQMMADAFGELAAIHKTAGCDMILLEMMYAPDRMQHAFAAARATGLPVWCGLSARVGDDGAVLSYVRQDDRDFNPVAKMAGEGGFDAAGIMHSSPNVTGPALEVLKRYFDGPLIAYPDSGFFKMPHWQFEDVIAPEVLHDFGHEWVGNGVRALGGCCGLSPAHIAALAPLKH